MSRLPPWTRSPIGKVQPNGDVQPSREFALYLDNLSRQADAGQEGAAEIGLLPVSVPFDASILADFSPVSAPANEAGDFDPVVSLQEQNGGFEPV